MKSKFLKAISLLCVFSIMGSFCSCTVSRSGGDTSKKTNSNKDGGVIDYSNLSQKDGTAVYTYKVTTPDGKEKEAQINIDFDNADKIEIAETGEIQSKRFSSTVGERDYHMTKEEVEKAKDEKSDFQEFSFVEYIENKSNKAMAFRSLKVDYHGKKDIWIKTALDAEYAIVPGSVYQVDVLGIADMSKYDEKALEEAFKDISIQLEYILVDSTMGDIDWENSQLKTMDIH